MSKAFGGIQRVGPFHPLTTFTSHGSVFPNFTFRDAKTVLQNTDGSGLEGNDFTIDGETYENVISTGNFLIKADGSIFPLPDTIIALRRVPPKHYEKVYGNLDTVGGAPVRIGFSDFVTPSNVLLNDSTKIGEFDIPSDATITGIEFEITNVSSPDWVPDSLKNDSLKPTLSLANARESGVIEDTEVLLFAKTDFSVPPVLVGLQEDTPDKDSFIGFIERFPKFSRSKFGNKQLASGISPASPLPTGDLLTRTIYGGLFDLWGLSNTELTIRQVEPVTTSWDQVTPEFFKGSAAKSMGISVSSMRTKTLPGVARVDGFGPTKQVDTSITQNIATHYTTIRVIGSGTKFTEILKEAGGRFIQAGTLPSGVTVGTFGSLPIIDDIPQSGSIPLSPVLVFDYSNINEDTTEIKVGNSKVTKREAILSYEFNFLNTVTRFEGGPPIGFHSIDEIISDTELLLIGGVVNRFDGISDRQPSSNPPSGTPTDIIFLGDWFNIRVPHLASTKTSFDEVRMFVYYQESGQIIPPLFLQGPGFASESPPLFLKALDPAIQSTEWLFPLAGVRDRETFQHVQGTAVDPDGITRPNLVTSNKVGQWETFNDTFATLKGSPDRLDSTGLLLGTFVPEVSGSENFDLLTARFIRANINNFNSSPAIPVECNPPDGSLIGQQAEIDTFEFLDGNLVRTIIGTTDACPFPDTEDKVKSTFNNISSPQPIFFHGFTNRENIFDAMSEDEFGNPINGLALVDLSDSTKNASAESQLRSAYNSPRNQIGAFKKIGFNVPSGALIVGVEVALHRRGFEVVQDLSVRLVVPSGDFTRPDTGDFIFGNRFHPQSNLGFGDRAKLGEDWLGSTVVFSGAPVIYGGINDLWDFPIGSITPELVNQVFSASIQFGNDIFNKVDPTLSMGVAIQAIRKRRISGKAKLADITTSLTQRFDTGGILIFESNGSPVLRVDPVDDLIQVLVTGEDTEFLLIESKSQTDAEFTALFIDDINGSPLASRDIISRQPVNSIDNNWTIKEILSDTQMWALTPFKLVNGQPTDVTDNNKFGTFGRISVGFKSSGPALLDEVRMRIHYIESQKILNLFTAGPIPVNQNITLYTQGPLRFPDLDPNLQVQCSTADFVLDTALDSIKGTSDELNPPQISQPFWSSALDDVRTQPFIRSNFRPGPQFGLEIFDVDVNQPTINDIDTIDNKTAAAFFSPALKNSVTSVPFTRGQLSIANFNQLNIPSGVTITGIEFNITRYIDPIPSSTVVEDGFDFAAILNVPLSPTDTIVRNITENAKFVPSQGSAIWPVGSGNKVTVSFGGTSDLWGLNASDTTLVGDEEFPAIVPDVINLWGVGKSRVGVELFATNLKSLGLISSAIQVAGFPFQPIPPPGGSGPVLLKGIGTTFTTDFAVGDTIKLVGGTRQKWSSETDSFETIRNINMTGTVREIIDDTTLLIDHFSSILFNQVAKFLTRPLLITSFVNALSLGAFTWEDSIDFSGGNIVSVNQDKFTAHIDKVEMCVYFTFVDPLTLVINGPTPFSTTPPNPILFTQGPIPFDSPTLTLFTQGPIPVQSPTFPLSVLGPKPFTIDTSAPLVTKGQDPTKALFGIEDIDNRVDLFLQGSKQEGGFNEAMNLTVQAAGVEITTSNMNLVIPGAGTKVTKILNLFVKNIGFSLDIPLFIQGPAGTPGFFPSDDEMPLFIKRLFFSNNTISLFMAVDETKDSVTLFVKGGFKQADDNITLFMPASQIDTITLTNFIRGF